MSFISCFVGFSGDEEVIAGIFSVQCWCGVMRTGILLLVKIVVAYLVILVRCGYKLRELVVLTFFAGNGTGHGDPFYMFSPPPST